MQPLCSAKSYNPFHQADVIEAPSAALGKCPPNPSLPFSCFAAQRGKTGKREVFILVSLPRAALRLPGAIIMSSLQDFSLARTRSRGVGAGFLKE